MTGKEANSHSQELKHSLNKKILGNTALNILVLVIVCCVIMAFSMQSLANNILLDSLQPMARQSAKTVEANVHMLADRMMTLAGDPRIHASETGPGQTDAETIRADREKILTEASEIYELHTIALYDIEGQLLQGTDSTPARLEEPFFSLLKETDNLTIASTTIFRNQLGITIGMPVHSGEETALYMVGVYKYDMLNDVISSINIGKNGMAYIVNREGVITGHPDPSVVMAGNTLLQTEGGNRDALSRITAGETGATEYSVNGQTMLVAFSPIRGTQWSLVIQVPKADYSPLINAALLLATLATQAFLFLSLFLVLRLARSISRPVQNVTNRMVALSDGDLHSKVIPVSSQDELEILTRTLDITVENFNHYISDIRQVLTQVAEGNLCVEPQMEYKGDFSLIQASLNTILQSMNQTISGFGDAASRLADMSEELNGQSIQLHQASTEQNQSTEALVCEVSHVKERLTNVTESSRQTRGKTEEIARRVQEANTRMASLSLAMDNISANAQEITQIAKAIEDIAFQTNILALNASVEAAHSGSAGKGFTVVAGEVKRLAARSAEAAQSATEMVNSTRAIIQTGVALTADTAGSLQSISSVTEQIRTISDQLVDAVQDQENALAIMDERIEAISAIADRNLQNAAGTEQSSGLLAQEAEALRYQVKKFALKEEPRQ